MSSVLSSLPNIRAIHNASASTGGVSRPEGSNVDVFVNPETGVETALCHLSVIAPYVSRGFNVDPLQDAAVMSLAAHHLNTGDGSIIPQVQGLNERCNVRFTLETADAGYSPKKSIELVVAQSQREPGGPEPIPCAFIGPYGSRPSVSTGIITGIYGYPMITSSATTLTLEDKSSYPLTGRTIVSDFGKAVPIILYMRDILHLEHLVVINVNTENGNAFANSLRAVAEELAPQMKIRQIPYDQANGSIEAVIEGVKESKYRFIIALIYGSSTQDAFMSEAFKQGVAGNGKHNWMFADGFQDLAGRVVPTDSDLFKAYQ